MSLSFKVDPSMKEALERLAAGENRSLSNYVITLLMRHLEEKSVAWQTGAQEKPERRKR